MTPSGSRIRAAGAALLAIGGVGALLLVAAASALAVTTGPQWTVTAVSQPTNFTAGTQAAYRVEVTNTGGSASDAGSPVTISDELPAGLTLGSALTSGEDQLARYRAEAPSAKFKCLFNGCTFTGSVAPEDTLIVMFPVEVAAGGPSSLTNVVRVAGGGAPDASARTPTPIFESEETARAQTSFGIAPGGSATALSSDQAGAHPDITTSLAFDTVDRKGSLAGNPKDLVTEEPSGFAGDLVDTPMCPPVKLSAAECAVGTQVGVATLTALFLNESAPRVESVPVYNLAPNPGEAAKFGFRVLGNFNIQGDVAVRPGDYGLRVSFHNTNDSGSALDKVTLTVWGVPAAPVHDTWRWKPEIDRPSSHFGISSEIAPAPYFTNPTSCGGQLEAKIDVNSWEQLGTFTETGMPFGPIVGCDRLAMPASFTAEPTTENADSPSGLDVNLGVKQTYENAEGLATSTLNKAVVTLPDGITVNPSAGAGLAACTLAQYSEEALEVSPSRGCPNNSKLGTVTIETPSLKEKGEGSVYLAEPAPNGEPGKNPFDSLLALYVVARFPERGVLVKVAGRVSADARTGRLVTYFEAQPDLGAGQPGLAGLPPVPFSKFAFRFHQGTTSPLVTPSLCGSYAASAALSPWSEPAVVVVPPLQAFAITHAFDGGACTSGVPPFAPQVIAGTLSNAAGSYSPMNIRVVRGDGEQEITRFSALLPPGLTANLSHVPFCSDAAIQLAREKTGAQEEAQPSCPSSSEIGHTLVGAGVGSVLAQAHGKLYMAGPYNGAPFSIAAITSAKVGPFDLGTVVVREALRIDPVTARVTVDATASDPIPHIIKGIVIHVRDIRVYVDRHNFILNPTSCAPLSITDTITGAGADPANPADQAPVTVTSPFQAAECQSLAFKPTFKVSTSGKTSRSNGASLSVNLSYPNAPQGTQANIRSVKVDLPKQLPSRLTTLQKACTAAQFNTNPAGCPVASLIGHARAITPILPVPLEGPAYFVSHGGEAFPSLIIVLQGYGVTLDLVGSTFISKQGITSSTFKTVPDAPVGSFELTLPQGKYSALAANGNLCSVTNTVTVKKKVTVRVKGHKKTVTRKVKESVAGSLTMPTAFVAQNGAVIHQSTPISVTGCGKAAKAKKKVRKKKGKKK
jgi:uncharacterized repeat protein (TIGR01451 family)